MARQNMGLKGRCTRLRICSVVGFENSSDERAGVAIKVIGRGGIKATSMGWSASGGLVPANCTNM